MNAIDNKTSYNDTEIEGFVNNSRLRASDEFETPPVILKVGDSVIGTLGNFSSSTGKAKSRKTFNVTAITAAAITNETILNYTACLPGDKRKVIFIDTEQSKYHCKKVFDRVLELADLTMNHDVENFEFFSLRPYKPAVRILIIEKIITSNQNIGLVIIDGIRDLAYDINSSHEATEVITKLMEWTDIHNIHIHTVLHQNKTDTNSRGHLGTELNNKSETVLKITVPENQKEVSIIESEFIRDRDFEPFAFSINDYGLPYLLDDFSLNENSSSSKGANPAEIVRQTHFNDILFEVYKEVDNLPYGRLYKSIKEVYSKYGKMGDNKAKEWVQYYVNQGYIEKIDKGYYLKEIP